MTKSKTKTQSPYEIAQAFEVIATYSLEEIESALEAAQYPPSVPQDAIDEFHEQPTTIALQDEDIELVELPVPPGAVPETFLDELTPASLRILEDL